MQLPHRRAAALAVAGLLALASAGATTAQEPLVVEDVNGDPVAIEDTSAVATLGGVFTETAYALGVQDQLVAVDDSSFYPPAALEEKPSFGYYRFLAAEPVLAQAPSLIIGNEETGPLEVVQQLRDAGVPILLLPDTNDIDAARDLITTMGTIFGQEQAAADLTAQLDADVAAAQELVAQAASAPRVLFILQPPDAPMLVAGEETAAGSMIELAGGANVFPGFPAFIPMTPEGIAEVAPDVILTTDDSVQRLGGMEAFVALPGIAQTPAVAADRVVSMDELYLLGFGPRTGQAIADLAQLLHPELAP
jgi:iron complex transport system substrate-binding protein